MQASLDKVESLFKAGKISREVWDIFNNTNTSPAPDPDPEAEEVIEESPSPDPDPPSPPPGMAFFPIIVATAPIIAALATASLLAEAQEADPTTLNKLSRLPGVKQRIQAAPRGVHELLPDPDWESRSWWELLFEFDRSQQLNVDPLWSTLFARDNPDLASRPQLGPGPGSGVVFPLNQVLGLPDGRPPQANRQRAIVGGGRGGKLHPLVGLLGGAPARKRKTTSSKTKSSSRGKKVSFTTKDGKKVEFWQKPKAKKKK